MYKNAMRTEGYLPSSEICHTRQISFEKGSIFISESVHCQRQKCYASGEGTDVGVNFEDLGTNQ